jgi:hypothetical protein
MRNTIFFGWDEKAVYIVFRRVVEEHPEASSPFALILVLLKHSLRRYSQEYLQGYVRIVDHNRHHASTGVNSLDPL